MKNYLVESMYSYMGKLEEARNPENEQAKAKHNARKNESLYESSNDIDKWVNILTKKLDLSSDEQDDLLHDLNNLRGDEWIEVVEKNIKDDKLVKAFKEFVSSDNDLDESCGKKKKLKEAVNETCIRIYKTKGTQIPEDAWDYPLDEIDYLIDEHPGESFVLIDDRLYELNI